MAGSILERQLGELGERFGVVEQFRLPSGNLLVTVQAYPLPPGWSAERTVVRFLVPPAYPFAALDCFWADNDLRLANGAVPQNAGADNPVADAGYAGLWFSWHLASPWDPNRDTLSSWMNTIGDRFRRPQ
jgi:hypothetical protein